LIEECETRVSIWFQSGLKQNAAIAIHKFSTIDPLPSRSTGIEQEGYAVSLQIKVFTGLFIASVALSNCYPIGAAPMVSPNPTISGASGASTSDQRDEQNDAATPAGTVAVPAEKSDSLSGKHHPKQLGRVVRNAFGIRTGKDTIHGGATARRVTGVESSRDMNLFALEPTVIDEHWYTSGKSERHQQIPGTTNEIVTVNDGDKPTYPYQESETKPEARGSKPAPSNTTPPNKSDYIHF
jgi:hypothetical protein